MRVKNRCTSAIIVFLGALLLAGCEDSVVNQQADSPSVAPLATGAHDGACSLQIPSDFDTIQEAINDADEGDVICVGAGTYEENPNVNKNITLRGATDPAGSSPAVIDGLIAVSAAGAEVKGLKVAPTTIFDINAGGLDPAGIKVTASDVLVEGNLIEGITGDATGDGLSGTVHGIQVWNDGPSHVTGVVVQNNTILDLHNMGDAAAGWPHYGGAAGIKVQGVVRDVEVRGNTVRGVHSAGWVYGVTLTHTGNDSQKRSPENVTVENNTLERLNDGSVYDVFADPASAPYPGAAFAIDDTENPGGPGGADADQATVRFNNFIDAPLGAQNKDQVHTLVAECNYWGHGSGPSEAISSTSKGASVVGDVDFRPWSVSEIDQDASFSCGPRNGTGQAAEVLKLVSSENQRIPEAIQVIEESLNDDWWVDENHLNPERGQEVFSRQRDAIEKLLSAIGDGLDPSTEQAVNEAIGLLVSAAEEIATIRLEEAREEPVQDPSRVENYEKEIESAEDEISRAENQLVQNHPDQAIDHYRQAWEHAEAAISIARK